MRLWDFRSPAARLHDAFDMLKKVTEGLAERWNDPAMDFFRTHYLVPLEANVREAIEAIGRLDEVFSEAAKECGDTSHE